MSDYTVIDHHHDEAAGVYRLTIGRTVIAPRPVVDADGEPVLDDDGRPVTTDEPVGYQDPRDYVWADDDGRWFNGGTRRDAGSVSDEQRAEVKALLDAATKAEQKATRRADAARKPMPGAGGPL